MNIRHTNYRRLFVRATAGIALTSSLLMAGCGIGSQVADTPETVMVPIKGLVHGGQQPVTGSHVALFATSSSGTGAAAYGAAATQLAHTTTDTTGSFTIPSGFTCPSNSEAYLVATGGNPGLTTGTDNSAIFLVAALGACNTATLATDVVDINEVTTVAAAYALSGFFPAGGAGMTEAAVIATADKGTMPGATTSSTNTQGLTDAFANANNIVSFTTGMAYTVAPSNTNSEVPQAVIHALADILQSCVNTLSASSAACASTSTPIGVLVAATPPVPSPTQPANVFQAALNIAQYPANNVAALFAQLSTTPAFPTTLTAAPTDWTVAVAYTGTTLSSPSGLGISSSDTVYVAGTGYLIDFNGQGGVLSGTNILTGVPSGDALRYMAFDSTGNLFIADGNKASTDTKVYELTTGGTVNILNYGTVGTNANTYNIAVDSLGDVWTSLYSKSTCSSVGCTLVEFGDNAGTYSPFKTFSGNTVTQPTGGVGGSRGVFFDVNKGNIWLTSIDDNVGELFTVTPAANGAVATAAAAPVQLSGLGGAVNSGADTADTGYGTISVAVDKSANAWFVTTGGPAVTTGTVTAAVAAQLTPVSSTGVVGSGVTGGGMTTPVQVIVDGNNNLFVANSGANSVVEYNTTLAAFESGAAGFLPTAADATHTLYAPSYLEADRSGALWVASSGSGTTHSAALLQILGVAAPTNPVQSAGQYGIKP